MDVIIKSFNRPYYLERCLHTLYAYVEDLLGDVYVLDDGTPQLYLDKIQSKFPQVIILKSAFYEEKQKKASRGIPIEKYKIPIDLWLATVQDVSDYFVLLEDDMWFTQSIRLSDIQKEMIENRVVMTKLFWLGNPDLIQHKSETYTSNLVLLDPKLYTKLPWLYDFIFYRFYCFKIKRILNLLGIHSEKKRIAYYTLYSVAGMIFEKNYFLAMWDNHNNEVSEGLQLFNAVKKWHASKGSYTVARLPQEVIKTGFISSASNQYKEHYAEAVDMNQFNLFLNEAWYEDKFSSLESLPKDISIDKILALLNTQNVIPINNWKTWYHNFRKQYIDIGCHID